MRVQEYIGVYHADGGLVGETKYFRPPVRRVHCSLCDITIRRCGARRRGHVGGPLDAPFRLFHLNEMPADVKAVVARVGSPVVLARRPPMWWCCSTRRNWTPWTASVAAFAGALASSAAPLTATGTD